MATLTERLNTLKAAIQAYTAALKTKAAAQRDSAVLADDAALLGSRTKAQVLANLKLNTNSHIADTSSNPHGDTAASIGVMGTDEFTVAGAKLIESGILPLSFYGSPDYLPPVVSGSYEGASSNSAMRGMPMFLEADDTLIYLRSGTNGSVNGLYYAFLRNASTATVLTPTYTNIKYAPSYFPSGRSAAYAYPSNQGVVCGRLQDSTGTLQECFLSLINGTMNAALHTGVIIPSSWEDILKRAAFAVCGDNLYIFSPTTDNTGVCAIRVYYVPVANFTGQTLSNGPTAITTWSTTGLYETVSADHVQIASKITATALSDKPAFLALNGAEGNYPYFGGAIPNCYAQVSGTKARVTFQGLFLARYSSSYGWVGTGMMTFSVVIDLATKVCAIDNGALGGVPLVQVDRSATAGALTITGAGYWSVTQLTGSTQSDTTTAWCVGGNGYEFFYQDNYYPDRNNRLTRRQISSWTTGYAALNVASWQARANTLLTAVIPTYGSAVGGQIRGWTPIATDRILLQSQGTKSDGTTVTGLALAAIGASGWTYKSVTRTSFPGYAPAAPRSMIAELVSSPDWYLNLLSEVTDTSVSASGAVLVEGWMLSRFLTVNRDLSTSGTISVTQAQVDALKTAVYQTWGIATGKDSKIELHIPQNTACPAYGILHVWTSDNVWRFAVFNLTVSARSGAIATLTAGSIINTYASTTHYPTGVMGGWYATETSVMGAGGAALTIYKGDDAYMYLGRTVLNALIVGITQMNIDFRMTCGLSDNTLSADAWTATFNAVQADTTRYGAWPGLGFGYSTHSANSDYYTKLLFAPQGKTKALFKSNPAIDYSKHQVLTSQDVASGWILYFTQAQPLMLSGTPYTLAATSVDLTTLTSSPASKTFYVYVKLVAGSPKYVVSLTELAESEACMFIGTVVTGSSAISTITINKVTRLDMIRISTTAVGSAMPVSSGYPGQGGTLTWT